MYRPTKKIAFAFPYANGRRAFIEGVCRYAHEHGREWEYVMPPEHASLSLRHLVGWNGDGVIAAIMTKQDDEIAASYHLPVVNVATDLEASSVPQSIADDQAIGELAAEHLIARGFRNYFYLGVREKAYSRRRFQGFQRRLKTKGLTAKSLLIPPFPSLVHRASQQQQLLEDWLLGLQLPCGIFAVNDICARDVINCCQRLEIAVPRHVSVICGEDGTLICQKMLPTISSIARNNFFEGFSAASMLDKLLRRRSSKGETTMIRPTHSISRESTATVVFKNQLLRKAVAHCLRHIAEAYNLNQLCSEMDLPRDALDLIFREHLGCSPAMFIRRQKREYMCKLLAENPYLAKKHIAELAGFASE